LTGAACAWEYIDSVPILCANVHALIPLGTGRHSTSLDSRNIFVETALGYALTYSSTVDHTKIGPTVVTILADTDYYSHPGASEKSFYLTQDRFFNFNVPLDQAHKTGLGSSAALVTALTTAVVAHYAPHEVVSAQSPFEWARMHNLAQAAHCAAQGKIGSGFDVAAATYGSCVYRRFSPSILEGLGEIGIKDFCKRLKSVIEDVDASRKWDTSIDKIFAACMPENLRLVMCDVDCGSQTVGMVKSVLSWKREKPEEVNLLWGKLQRRNEDLATELHELVKVDTGRAEGYDNLRTTVLAIRSLIREMSTKSGVPVEPKAQTDLIDACCRIPGVVGGVVPGAGGFDAIALLVEDKQEIIDSLRRFLKGYRVSSEHGQGSLIRKVRLLGVKQEDQGVKREDPSQYKGWLR